MRVEIERTKPAFVPVKVVIDIESKEDARAVYAMFNYSPFAKAIGRHIAEQARGQLGHEYHTSVTDPVIARGVRRADFFS